MAHQTIFLQGDEVISALDEKRIFGKALVFEAVMSLKSESCIV